MHELDRMNYVMSVMKEINRMTDDIYESLADGVFEDTYKSVEELIPFLENLKENINPEIN